MLFADYVFYAHTGPIIIKGVGSGMLWMVSVVFVSLVGYVREEVRDGLPVVGPPDGLGEHH